MSFSDLFNVGERGRRNGHFAALVSIANASGMTDDEMVMLERFKSRLDITDSDFQAIIENPAGYPIEPPTSSERRLERLHDLFKIAFADKNLSDAEARLLKKYATALGYSDEDAAYLIKRSTEIFSGYLSLEDYRYLLNKNR
jgi:uncharacterized tellurite resistance protein B-like protein